MSKRKIRLCVLTFGVIVSLIVFTPPCFPLKIEANKAWEQLESGQRSDTTSSKLKKSLKTLFTFLDDKES